GLRGAIPNGVPRAAPPCCDTRGGSCCHHVSGLLGAQRESSRDDSVYAGAERFASAGREGTMPLGGIRVGSLTAPSAWQGDERGHDVAWIFGTPLRTSAAELAGAVDLDLAFGSAAVEEWPERPRIPPDGMVLRGAHPCREVHTEVVSARIDLA